MLPPKPVHNLFTKMSAESAMPRSSGGRPNTGVSGPLVRHRCGAGNPLCRIMRLPRPD